MYLKYTPLHPRQATPTHSSPPRSVFYCCYCFVFFNEVYVTQTRLKLLASSNIASSLQRRFQVHMITYSQDLDLNCDILFQNAFLVTEDPTMNDKEILLSPISGNCKSSLFRSSAPLKGPGTLYHLAPHDCHFGLGPPTPLCNAKTVVVGLGSSVSHNHIRRQQMAFPEQLY